jgi:hypothetical protein
VAHVLVISNAALFTYRNGRELRSELLYGGSDPSKITIDRTLLEILHVRLGKEALAGRTAAPFHVSLFVKASPSIKVTTVNELIERIASLAQVSEIFAEVRQDTWFLQDDSYPVAPAWIKLPPLPSEREYRLGPYLNCSLRLGEIRCGGDKFEP